MWFPWGSCSLSHWEVRLEARKSAISQVKGGEQRPRQRASAMRQEVGSAGCVNVGAGTSGRASEG